MVSRRSENVPLDSAASMAIDCSRINDSAGVGDGPLLSPPPVIKAPANAKGDMEQTRSDAGQASLADSAYILSHPHAVIITPSRHQTTPFNPLIISQGDDRSHLPNPLPLHQAGTRRTTPTPLRPISNSLPSPKDTRDQNMLKSLHAAQPPLGPNADLPSSLAPLPAPHPPLSARATPPIAGGQFIGPISEIGESTHASEGRSEASDLEYEGPEEQEARLMDMYADSWEPKMRRKGKAGEEGIRHSGNRLEPASTSCRRGEVKDKWLRELSTKELRALSELTDGYGDLGRMRHVSHPGARIRLDPEESSYGNAALPLYVTLTMHQGRGYPVRLLRLESEIGEASWRRSGRDSSQKPPIYVHDDPDSA